ncbi:uncharacterized protein TRAVEDRAFT_115709, partial [Trametes versicolor FP-101664 SS1]|uniref:uncharacterized protein n=1 Tax=Trametes versicolor (strain FP-101664) TaxID=717944 RepID=UPI0004622ED1
PIQDFFANYPDFEYNSKAPFLSEFKRMGKDLGWKTKEREAAMDDLRDAMVKQFNAMYGTRVDALESWRLLCSALGMNPAPKDIKKCHRVIISAHVNLVDLIEAPLSGQSVQTFDSEIELSAYTKPLRKYFPRNNVNTGSLLRYLLRQIKKPHPRRRRGDGKSPRKATAGKATTLPT